MQATKESGQTDFEFTTDTFSEINMENFINQRKDGAFRKLTLEEKLQTMPPRSASNAVMSATFSAINEDEDTPSNQNYELIISFGYVIRFVIEFMYCLYVLLVGTKSGFESIYLDCFILDPFSVALARSSIDQTNFRQ